MRGERATRVDLYTFGNDHRWGTIHQKPGPKRLQYVSFGAFPEDYDRIVAAPENPRRRRRSRRIRSPTRKGTWFVDPEGTPVQLVVSRKVTPAEKPVAAAATPPTPGHPRGAVALEGRHGAAAPAFAHPALQLGRHALGALLLGHAGAAPVRSLRRHHRLPARRARERSSPDRVRQVGRSRACITRAGTSRRSTTSASGCSR